MKYLSDEGGILLKRTTAAIICMLIVLGGLVGMLLFQNTISPATSEGAADPARRVDKEEVTLAQGRALVIPLDLGAEESPLSEWSSSDPAVVSVDNGGRIDAVKQGSATVSAKFSDGQSYTCQINVSSPKEEEEVDRFTTAILANQELAQKNVQNKADGKTEMHPYRLHVNRRMNCVTVYTYGSDNKYTVPVRAMTCSCGKDDRTITGLYNIYTHNEWQFLEGDVFGQYASAIAGDFLFHSVPYRDLSKETLMVDEYNRLGEAASMGCIRMAVGDCRWIYDNCENGTIVVLFDSNSPGPLGKPESIRISDPKCHWDPTDRDPNNPYNKAFPKISGVKDQTVPRGSGYRMTDGVTAIDSCGNDMTDKLEIIGNVNTDRPGVYKVTYRATDALHRVTEEEATVTVKETA